MYRHDQPLRGPRPRFMPAPKHPTPFRPRGPFSLPRPGNLPQRPAGQFPPSGSLYLHNRPPSDRYTSAGRLDPVRYSVEDNYVSIRPVHVNSSHEISNDY